MKKSAQCGQVTAAYSIKVTGAFGSPCAFSPSGPGAITSSAEASAKAGRTNPKPYGRTPKIAPASARAAVPANNSRRVTRAGSLLCCRHGEERSDESIEGRTRCPGLLRRRYAPPRNDVLAGVASVNPPVGQVSASPPLTLPEHPHVRLIAAPSR